MNCPVQAAHVSSSVRSLRTKAEDDSQKGNDDNSAAESENQQHSDNERTVFWVVSNKPQTLPRGHERAACLLLQALLIHGSLPENILSAVLPSVGETNLVIALIRSGFVERHNGEVRCVATAYPTIWRSLTNSGMSMAPF